MPPALRLRRILLALCLLAALAAPFEPAAAQDAKEAARMLGADERRMDAIYTLDYAMRELMWHQSMAILAAYGGYNSYERADGSANSGDLRRLTNRIGLNRESLADFRRSFARDRDLPEADTGLVTGVVEDYEYFLAAAETVAEHLDAGDAEAANIAYRDGSVPVAKSIGADLYTLRRAARDRFQKTARAQR
ncbi:hypothetical protein R5H32_10095 [Defluviimonas sp. D31]|uniref:hypothetical protein n=1 Tax=Defluviimonas sp. D31 TaxID=3083253 RepID=UPI00296F28A1|nr:hypothetical protein [Defluviimonas sp. D31]MDW4549703.1 hypothetical protein [Defluviimonas sp. D31]